MRTIFSYYDEEELKRDFFAGSEPGVFVEVGANEPRTYSQTWSLEERGWTGVLIEPQPDLAATLRRERKAKVFAVACSSPAEAGSRRTLHLAGPQSSFDADLNVAHVRPHGTIEVPLRTLDDVLTEAGLTRIDFMSIDVEGHELDVLAGFDLPRWRPRLLVVEDLLVDWRLHHAITARGYRWIRRSGINNWYVPADTPIRLGIDGTLQYLNKVYLGTPFRRLRHAVRRVMARAGA